MPQQGLGFTSKNKGAAIAITNAEHAATRTYGRKGFVTIQTDANLSFREVLYLDIKDLRGIAGSKYNVGMKQMIQYYREKYPELMKK